MLNPKHISNHNTLSKEQQKALEKTMQLDGLSYLSSIAFDQFNVSNSEIESLSKRIDTKAGKSFRSFNTVFISLMCGLFIGITIFFVIFQKNKTHPSVWQVFNDDSRVENKLNNTVLSTDTVFPEAKPQPIVEHYNTVANNTEEIKMIVLPEVLPIKTSSLTPDNDVEEDIILQFIPNAPVLFISNLKITNYRIYYFKRSEAVDLSVNSGVAAQYESKANIERTPLNKSNAYLAHKIIQKSMRLFSSKNLTNCIEELNLLYNFNNDDANAQFYLGMCYYQLGKYSLSQNFFQKNLDNENNIFHQESEFYQALCLLHTNQTEKGTEQLQHIVTSKGFYTTRAQEILAKKK